MPSVGSITIKKHIAEAWVDTFTEDKDKREAKQTAGAIRMVYHCLTKYGPKNQGEIVERLKAFHAERIVNQVLARQESRMWTISAGDHNSKINTAIEGAKVPAPPVKSGHSL